MSCRFYNDLEIIGTDDQVKEVLNYIRGNDKDGNEMCLDFNKIIKMPEELQNEPDYKSSPIFENLINEDPLIDKEQILEKLKHEFFEKREKWRYKNWGCLYNVRQPELKEDCIISYSSLNGSGFRVINKLSEIFPKVLFIIFIFEESPDNDELLTIKDGRILKGFDYDYFVGLVRKKQIILNSLSKLETGLIDSILNEKIEYYVYEDDYDE